MNEESLRGLLESVRHGDWPIHEAMARLRSRPFEDLGFAKIDHHRSLRCGFPEVIYCEHKSVDQAAAIFDSCVKAGGNMLATRASREVYDAVASGHSKA